jgi:putative transcriptional regulator
MGKEGPTIHAVAARTCPFYCQNEAMAAAESLRGRLLIAGPKLFDPNFRRTVVLVGEHNADGALGVVLNRPSGVTVEEVVPALAPLAGQDSQLFLGGPVQSGAAVALAEFDDPDAAGVLAFGSIGFLTGDVSSEAGLGIRRARIYAGYAGWGEGQLEEELEEESWILEPALAEDVFTEDPEGLWSAVLRRKGPKYRLLATMPFDPSLN